MFKWISGYMETFYLMRSRANRDCLRASIAQAERGEVTKITIPHGKASLYLGMLSSTEIDFESNSAYVRLHRCTVAKTDRYDEQTNIDICAEGKVVGVEIFDFISCLLAPTSAGSDIEDWHTEVEESVLAARSFVLQNLMKSGLDESRPIHK